MTIDRLTGMILSVTICVLCLTGCNGIHYNNTASKDDLITVQYPAAKIEELKNAMPYEDITFSEFRRTFRAQCIRQTHQGHYVVLQQDDASNAFVFFNKENILTDIIVTDGFLTENQFQTQMSCARNISDLIAFDPITQFTPYSSVTITGHIVQEGVFVVTYSRERNVVDGEVISVDEIISSVAYYDNASISTGGDVGSEAIAKDEIPYILEIDKISR